MHKYNRRMTTYQYQQSKVFLVARTKLIDQIHLMKMQCKPFLFITSEKIKTTHISLVTLVTTFQIHPAPPYYRAIEETEIKVWLQKKTYSILGIKRTLLHVQAIHKTCVPA